MKKKICTYSITLDVLSTQTEKRFTIDMERGAEVLPNGFGAAVLEGNDVLIYAIVDSNNFNKDKEEHFFVLVKFNELTEEPIKSENFVGRLILDTGTFFLFEKHKVGGLELD